MADESDFSIPERLARMEFPRVASSVFRVTYVLLDHPRAVTVLGRVIGWYIPVPRPGQESERASSPAQGVAVGSEIPAAGVAPGRPEAPDATAGGRGPAPRSSRSGVGSAPQAGMSQTDKDKVLRRVRERV